MPSQQVEIAEAIAGIKRALKREREAPSDQPAVAASNRGNKLKQGAKYVHEGSLTYMSGPEAYKQRIQHAGYTRHVLDRNPRRYNEYGEELEDSETDEEADADAADQNAYSGIRLEELLCPLKHPSELPVHPTMSHAYLSSALPDMVLSTHEKLRQERANLWRAKYLNRQLIGDASWLPAGQVESPNDWELFEPRKTNAQQKPSQKRKRREDEGPGKNGNFTRDPEVQPESEGISKDDTRLTQDNMPVQPNGVDVEANVETTKAVLTSQGANEDASNGEEVAEVARETALESKSAGFGNALLGGTGNIPDTGPNGVDISTDQIGTDKDAQNQAHPLSEGINTGIHHAPKMETGEEAIDQPLQAVPDDGSRSPPPPPPRRITRALAANNNSNPHSNTPTPPLSSASSSTTSSSSSQLQIDPLYLVPQSANPLESTAAFHGLLPEEALETRRILTLYVQKQEESVRGYEAILSKLLTAQRLRMEVLEMCKTEEHVGELSDGEDWIDTERWGLQAGELRKGRDEDDDVMEENTIGGRKGKRRARN